MELIPMEDRSCNGTFAYSRRIDPHRAPAASASSNPHEGWRWSGPLLRRGHGVGVTEVSPWPGGFTTSGVREQEASVVVDIVFEDRHRPSEHHPSDETLRTNPSSRLPSTRVRRRQARAPAADLARDRRGATSVGGVGASEPPTSVMRADTAEASVQCDLEIQEELDADLLDCAMSGDVERLSVLLGQLGANAHATDLFGQTVCATLRCPPGSERVIWRAWGFRQLPVCGGRARIGPAPGATTRVAGDRVPFQPPCGRPGLALKHRQGSKRGRQAHLHTAVHRMYQTANTPEPHRQDESTLPCCRYKPRRVLVCACGLLGCRALPGASPAVALRQPPLTTTTTTHTTPLDALCLRGVRPRVRRRFSPATTR